MLGLGLPERSGRCLLGDNHARPKARRINIGDGVFRDTGAADLAHPRKFCFRCDSDLAQFAVLRAGMGIGGCQQNTARRFKELVPVLAETIRFELEVWIAMHEDMRSTGRVPMLFDHCWQVFPPLSAVLTSIEAR
jgi:hypothetical protein